MLIEIFKSVLVMSMAGSLLGLFWLCLKPLTRKLFSPAWQYYIWLTVLAVMVIPVSFSMPKTADIPDFRQHMQTAAPEFVMGLEEKNVISEENAEISDMKTVRLPNGIMWYLSIMWGVGAAVILSVNLVKYVLFLRAIHKNSAEYSINREIPKRLSVRRTKLLDAPLIVGIIKPVLYFPDIELSENSINYVLMHELTHYRRLDIIYKWFAMLVKSIHWFNPVIYVISGNIDEDCEISCDYYVKNKLDKREQKEYMNMILDMLSAVKCRSLTTQMAGGKKILRRRFNMIVTKKKTNKFTSAVSALTAAAAMTAAIFAGGVTSASVNGGSDIAIIGGADGPTSVFVTSNSIQIMNGGNRVDTVNKPFIANNTIYLPLREMLNKAGLSNKDISYDNGCVEFYVRSEKPIEYRNELYDFWINRVRIDSAYVYIGGFSHGSTENDMLMRSPVLADGVTYVPYELFEKLSDSGQGVFDDLSVISDNDMHLMGKGYINENLNFSIELPLSWCGKYIAKENGNLVNFYHKKTYDKYGSGEIFSLMRLDKTVSQNELDLEEVQEPVRRKVVMQSGNSTFVVCVPGETQGEKWEDYEEFKAMQAETDFIGRSILPIVVSKDGQPKDPLCTVTEFFAAFEQGRYYIMENLCTEQCIETFFKYPDSVFGMEWAKLEDMSVNEKEYLKSSNDFNVMVNVEIKPAEISVFDKTQSETTFFVRLIRQPDGRYLIDGFATGI